MRTKYPTSTRALVGLVAAGGGCVESRIRLQKQVFLLRWLNRLPELACFRFSYRHFGPYSPELSEALHDAIRGGLLHDARADVDRGRTRYTYWLTDAGRRIAPAPTDGSLIEVVRWLGCAPWRTVELTATTLFLEQHRGLDPDAALRRALALKPAWQERCADSVRVVRSLRSIRGSA